MNFRKITIYFLVFVLLLGTVLTVVAKKARADISISDCEAKLGKGILKLDEEQQCQTQLEKLAADTSTQKKSLQSEIAKFNAAVAITETKILTTTNQITGLENEIVDLASKIGKLDDSLNQVSEYLIKRIAATYKAGSNSSFLLLLSSSNLTDFTNRLHYLKITQLHDRNLMFQMESVRTDYEAQKNLKQEKQQELEDAKTKLESQKILLAQQKADREKLLQITQNNEAKYQQLLAVTRSEIEAIQNIIAGKGQESEVGPAKQGQTIASIIQGASPCSTGTHLHFEVRDGENVVSPFDHLKNVDLVDDSGGDPHTGTGDWDWPLNGPIKFNQGYGANTSAIRSKLVWYSFHTGIDIVSSNSTVKSVKDGTLYRGSIKCGNGILRYVRVKHGDSNFNTYYLHVNY
jgi:peptidoglycan hydrolase CwlO-like protein